jgi:hypothetical protein
VLFNIAQLLLILSILTPSSSGNETQAGIALHVSFKLPLRIRMLQFIIVWVVPLD